MHRTVPSRAFVHLNVFHRRRYTRPAHRAHTRYGPAHVSANLIYFGPDKKLIYRKARQSWETIVFFFYALGREPEVTRRLARVSRGADRVTMRSLPRDEAE